MDITTYCIDEWWNIQKQEIAFKVFTKSDTVDNSHKLNHEFIEEYGLTFMTFFNFFS